MELQKLNKSALKEIENLQKSLGLAAYSNDYRLKTVADVVFSKEPIIMDLVRKYELKTIVQLLSLEIRAVSDRFNVGKNMNADQIILCAKGIIDRFPFYKLSDFKKCFENAVSGKYGKSYDRIDEPTILEWLYCYDIERQMKIEEYQRQKAKENILKPNELSNDYVSLLKNAETKMSNKADVTKHELTEAQKWLVDFDVLFIEQVKSGMTNQKGIRFVNVDGVMMDIELYLKYRRDK